MKRDNHELWSCGGVLVQCQGYGRRADAAFAIPTLGLAYEAVTEYSTVHANVQCRRVQTVMHLSSGQDPPRSLA
jgi:hypothetical protein